MLTMFMNRHQASQHSWDKDVDNTVYGKRKKFSCCMITCIAIGATLFFLIGLFQTVLVFAFARESSRGPILVMGPVFMGIGAMMYMAVIEMCIVKHKKNKQVTNVAPEAADDDGTLDEKEKAIIEQELGLPNNKNTIVLRADQLPAMLTLNQEDLQRLGPDSKQMLMQPLQPMMTPVDVCMTHVPQYYAGNPSAARPIPSSAVYQLPSTASESVANTERGVTEQESGRGELNLCITCEGKLLSEAGVAPSAVAGPSAEGLAQNNENMQTAAVESAADGEDSAGAAVETPPDGADAASPAPDPDAPADTDSIPDEILEMLDKVQEVYRNDTPAEEDPNDAESGDAEKPAE